MKRRQFLAATAAATAPLFIPARAFGANDRVVTAHIGVGNQGTGNLMRLAENAAVICDVDQTMLEKAAMKFAKDKGRKLELETDFRRVLDRKDIDAVVITTPDHWHAIPTIMACQAGKDVYCEKPLSLTIDEGQAMVKAARENQRVVQTGSQQRSSKEFLLACRWFAPGRSARLPKCKLVSRRATIRIVISHRSRTPSHHRRSTMNSGSGQHRCDPITSITCITTSDFSGITLAVK